ncbi:MAG: GNAT family N-acetyltransferase [Clostridia bacterium]|nr:GNAT family N-acetyltransferase [Clostridia bacterium]
MPIRQDEIIERATAADAQEIYALYHSLVDMPYGTWNEEYPSRDLVDEDLKEAEVFVMRCGGRIVSAIVNENTHEFDELAAWYPDVARWAQFGRLGVAKDMQGRGIARKMLAHAMEKAREEGCDAVRFLVGAQNLPAQRSYAKLGFEICGEADAWGERWLCYEKRL